MILMRRYRQFIVVITEPYMDPACVWSYCACSFFVWEIFKAGLCRSQADQIFDIPDRYLLILRDF